MVQGLSKNFGSVNAVQNLSFTVEPGSVTGFLGPNGSGKTTTLRMILGLVKPTTGTATINGLPFWQLPSPAKVAGAVLEAQSFHPGRSARNHLRCYAAAVGVPDHRADQVLELVGLSSVGTRKTGGFSLGMRQRLALATALLGDPQILLLDEPANGLDPEGIAWLRNFLKTFASTGRTVLVSSHLLREMEPIVDHVVIVSRGQGVYNGHVDDLRQQQQARVLVEAADPDKFTDALRESGLTADQLPDGRLAVPGSDSRTVADIALRAGVALYAMQEEQIDLEQLFFRLTSGEFVAGEYAPDDRGQWSAPGDHSHGASPEDHSQWRPPESPSEQDSPGQDEQAQGEQPQGERTQNPDGEESGGTA
jgi:ABC-2 type transport system ATP-binding protein